MILYCWIIAEVQELQDLVKCPGYISALSLEEEEAAAINAWLSEQPCHVCKKGHIKVQLARFEFCPPNQTIETMLTRLEEVL